MTRRFASLALAAVLAACYGATDASDRPPARLELRAGQGQTATVGTPLPAEISVRVLGRDGRPVRGEPVTFRVVSGGGTVETPAAETGGDGVARTRWVLGTVAGDTQRVEAAATRGQGGTVPTLVFRALGVPDVPVQVTRFAGAEYTTGVARTPLPDSLALRVMDRYGNGVPQTAVVWTVRLGGGTVSPGTVMTDGAGVARTQWTLGWPVDTLQLVEAAAGPTLRATFAADVTGFPLGLQAVPVAGNGATGSVNETLADSVVVRVTAADGTPAPGLSVTWEPGPEGGSASPAVSRTDAAGRAATAWRMPTAAGPAALTARVHGQNAPVAHLSATARPGPVTVIEAVSGDGQLGVAATALYEPLRVRLRDAFQNPVAGAVVRWRIRTGGGSLAPDSSFAGADGVAQTSWTLGTGGPQGVRASHPEGRASPRDFAATLHGAGVRLTVVSPGGDGFVGDTARVEVTATSASPVRDVTATVRGRTVALRRDGTTWSGAFPMVGLPAGPSVLRVAAGNARGETSTADVPITYNRAPVLTVAAPLPETVTPAGAAVDASCTDGDGGTCTVSVSIDGGAPLASAPGRLQAAVSLAAAEGRRVSLVFAGRDDEGQTVTAARTVFVESSPRLAEREAAGYAMTGAGAGFVTYRDSTGRVPTLFLRARATGAVQSLSTEPADGEVVTPGGAVFLNADPTQVFEREGDRLVRRGYALPGSVKVAGNHAVWRYFFSTALMSLNMDTGTLTHVFYRMEAGEYDVAANGELAFQATGVVYRRAGNENTAVARSVGTAAFPRIDGGWVTFVRPGGILVRAAGETGHDTLAVDVPAGEGAAMRGGWIAFRRTAGGAPQVWTRAPDGTLRQATNAAGGARLDFLGAGGEVVFTAGGRRYATRAPYAAAVDVGAAFTEARFFWVDGQVWMTLGREALSLTF
jgi:hypothetical protein